MRYFEFAEYYIYQPTSTKEGFDIFRLYAESVTGYLSAILLTVIILTGGISKKFGLTKNRHIIFTHYTINLYR